MAQALVKFLSAQHTERDGRRQPFFAGMFGIAQEQLGHASISTTLNMYAHVVDASHRKAVERELFGDDLDPNGPKSTDRP